MPRGRFSIVYNHGERVLVPSDAGERYEGCRYNGASAHGAMLKTRTDHLARIHWAPYCWDGCKTRKKCPAYRF